MGATDEKHISLVLSKMTSFHKTVAWAKPADWAEARPSVRECSEHLKGRKAEGNREHLDPKEN